MKILLNGQPHETRATTVAALLDELEIPRVGVAIAQNEVVVPRANHATQILSEGDKIEIVRAVQGG